MGCAIAVLDEYYLGISALVTVAQQVQQGLWLGLVLHSALRLPFSVGVERRCACSEHPSICAGGLICDRASLSAPPMSPNVPLPVVLLRDCCLL
jgi:hypothetical protein